MPSLSIQSVDEQLAALLKQRAAAARKSVSQFVLDTLRQHLGLEKEKRFTAD
jgi:plasmid stability protein